MNLDLDSLSPIELQSLYDQVMSYYKYNSIETFKPYPYQLDFMNKSKKFHSRLMRSGNQTGKSYGAAYEFAMHVTGLYQDYYEGDRIEGSGYDFWCIGIKLDSTARVIQKLLFGTEDMRNEDAIGTGAIPRRMIDFESISKDGKRLLSARVKHVSGGYNTISFFAAEQGQNGLMGSVVKFVWIDEEHEHKGVEVYAQCVTRTATTKGHILMTATPEFGMTPLQKMFEDARGGDDLYIASASWDDAPHLDEEDIKRLLANIPEWQRDMRRHGLPVLGSGAVFPCKDEDLMCEDITPRDHWPVIVGLDFSSVNDASVISFVCHNTDDDIYYLYKEIYINEIENKNPDYMSDCILNGETPYIPCISPHDGGLNSASPTSKAKIMISRGVNVQSESFYNGTELSLSFKDKKNFHREPGLEYMRKLIRDGRFKVCKSCVKFYEEKRSLFYSPKPNGGIETKGKDDSIDACRYALISLVGNRGLPYGQCKSGDYEKWNNGFDVNRDNTIWAVDVHGISDSYLESNDWPY
ncbi:MAG: terminase large subunit domain-containing protein [Cetobacterium sp.]|uniref:terminase large subunit domain-containing protein n=1 Tax=Cetobacterium sp. TaxID=2071632 RepID=UPI003EE733A3